MEKILKVKHVNDYARYIGAPVLHPLVSVIHYDELEHCRHSLNNYDVYAMFIGDETLEQLTYGLPTVRYCAQELFLSPNYFGDLIRQFTGDTASNIIRRFVMQRAKELLAGSTPIGQVAEQLGFDYPQHFTRQFKSHFGITPTQFVKGRK